MPTIEIHGIYKVRAPQPCHIVEITVHESEGKLDLGEVNFPVKVGRHKTIQAPFEEHFLSTDGETILGNFLYAWNHEHAWIGEVRLAFLMHYLTPGEAIKTPHGDVAIPDATKRPDRLKAIKFRSPY